MRIAIVVGLVLLLGFASGFFAGRWTAPTASDPTVEQTGQFAGQIELGTREVFYPQSFVSPPELTVVEENQDPHSRWEWIVLEQRKDGFKLKFTGWGGTSRNKLRYTARGTTGGATR